MTPTWLVYVIAVLGFGGIILVNLLVSDSFWGFLSKIKKKLRQK